MLLLEFRNVSKTYRRSGGTVTALGHLSLAVSEFQRVVIIGRSGSGKTTLLRLAAGLERPTEGEILFRGGKVDGPSRRCMMVFQEPRLFPWKTVYHNVWLGTSIESSEVERKRRVEEILALVGLEGHEQAYPDQLSGGMAQRAALARALAGDPELLLMDEPLGSLDAFTRSELQQQLIRIWEAKRQTVLFVTHDVEEAILLADRIVVLGEEGKITADVAVDLPIDRKTTDRDFNTIRQKLMELLFGEQV